MKEGDIVFHITKQDCQMVVTGICSNGEIRCSYFDNNGVSQVSWFFPFEIADSLENKKAGFENES